MKRLCSLLLVLVMVFSFPLQVSAHETTNSGYESASIPDNIDFIVDYSLVGNVVHETLRYYEDSVLKFTLVKQVYPDNTFIAYKDGHKIYNGETEYSIFWACATDSTLDLPELSKYNTRQTYYPCGYTDPHTSTGSSFETINLDYYYTISDLIAVLGAISLGGYYGAAYTAIYNAAARLKEMDADYVDVTQYKFFVQNYNLNTAYNCYHNYYKAYNVLPTGATETVDAWNTYYQEML